MRRSKELLIKGYRRFIKEHGGWKAVNQSCRDSYNLLRKGLNEAEYQELIKRIDI
jgi:aminoglycoside phosphotransferase family enzyme